MFDFEEREGLEEFMEEVNDVFNSCLINLVAFILTIGVLFLIFK